MNDENGEFVPKTITIRKNQEEWIQKNHFKLAPFVQEKLDEVMKERT